MSPALAKAMGGAHAKGVLPKKQMAGMNMQNKPQPQP